MLKIGRHTFASLFFECSGSFLISIAPYNIVLAAGFPMSGFSGIAIILHRLFGLPIGLTTIALNIPVAFLCYKVIGRAFLLRSLRCMVISSLMIDYIAPLFPMYTGDRMLAAIAAGVIIGLGFAMIYMRNTSTGGSDFIVMAVKATWPHLKLGNIVFAFDFIIVLAGGLIFNDLDGIIYGVIVNYLLSVVVDKVMYGLNAGKVAFIVSDDGKRIYSAVSGCCERGSTIIPAVGGYSGQPRDIVMIAASTKDMYSIEKAVKHADPNSFMIIMESNEVHGLGFNVTRVAEASRPGGSPRRRETPPD